MVVLPFTIIAYLILSKLCNYAVAHVQTGKETLLKFRRSLSFKQMKIIAVHKLSWLERCTGIAEVMGSIPVQA